MIVWLRRSRVLRLLLAVFLVPLIIVTASNTARASEALASNVITIKTDVNFTSAPSLISNPDCLIQVDALAGALRVHTGYCEVGVTPEVGCEILEPDCTSISVQYKGNGGCVLSAPVYLDRFNDGWFTNRVYVTSPARQIGTCEVQEVCIVIDAEVPMWPDAKFTGCQPLGMAVDLDTASGVCDLGTGAPRVVSTRYDIRDGGTGYSPWYGRRDVTFDYAFTGGSWRAYALLRDDAGHVYGTALNSAMNYMESPAEALHMSNSANNMTASGTEVTFAVRTTENWAYNGTPKVETREIIGVGFYRNTSANTYDHQHTPSAEPIGHHRFGVTDPSRCAFYWGENIWDDGTPGEGIDEPLGPVPVAYEPDSETELPDDLDVIDGPATEGGFWAAVVDILGRILGALRDIAGSIAGLVTGLVTGLGDLLRSLFVPSEGFLSDGVDDLRDQVEDSNVGEWNDAFSGLFSGGATPQARGPAEGGEGLMGSASASAQNAPSGLDFGGGGCQGPSIDISMITPEGMGSELDTLHPFAACQGMTAEMAGWSRLLSTLFLALFGGFKIFGLVASSAFGLKQTEIMRGFDWSSDRLDGRSM